MKTGTPMGSAACTDHLCDGCIVCRKGQCCRRDLPDYRLPETGDWDGPVWGDLGVLLDDGEHIQCHICGEWLASLGIHILYKHGVWVEEYKAYFGLYKSKGLVSTATAAKQSQHALDLVAAGKVPNLRLYALTPEQQSQSSSQPRRLQNQAAQKVRSERLRGKRHSAAHIEANRLGHLGKKLSAETRAKLSEAGRGRRWSLEAKREIGDRVRGTKHSLEANAKVAASWTPERRAALIERNRVGGWKASPETRAKLSAAHLGKQWSPERRAAQANRKAIGDLLQEAAAMAGAKT